MFDNLNKLTKQALQFTNLQFHHFFKKSVCVFNFGVSFHALLVCRLSVYKKERNFKINQLIKINLKMVLNFIVLLF